MSPQPACYGTSRSMGIYDNTTEVRSVYRCQRCFRSGGKQQEQNWERGILMGRCGAVRLAETLPGADILGKIWQR